MEHVQLARPMSIFDSLGLTYISEGTVNPVAYAFTTFAHFCLKMQQVLGRILWPAMPPFNTP